MSPGNPLTCELIGDYLARRRARMAAVGVEVSRTACVFSPDPAGEVPWNPDTMTRRYRRYADRVGITSSLRKPGTSPPPSCSPPVSTSAPSPGASVRQSRTAPGLRKTAGIAMMSAENPAIAEPMFPCAIACRT
jgi:hypothetical protein